MQESYSIELVRKSDDPEFIESLKIYDLVTPVDIKTDPNDLSLWVEKNSQTFKTYIFKLFCNDNLIGLAMTTYLINTKIMLLEYIAVEKSYKKNIVYLSCINLLGQYFNQEESYSINYWLTDINNKNNGHESDSESKILNMILDLEGYKKVDAKFITPELGITDIPGFEAYFMIKTTDSIKSISKNTYRGIIKSIYYEYYLPWYQKILNKNDFKLYEDQLNSTYKKLDIQITQVTDPIKVIDIGYDVLQETTGHTPIRKKISYINILKNILKYLLIALISIVIGAVLGFIMITYLFPNLPDKGAVVAAIIGTTTTVSLAGIYKGTKIKK